MSDVMKQRNITDEFVEAKDEFGEKLFQSSEKEFLYAGEDPEVTIKIVLPDDYPETQPTIYADGNDITTVLFSEWIPVYSLTDILTLALKYYEADEPTCSFSKADMEKIEIEVMKGNARSDLSRQSLVQNLPSVRHKRDILSETQTEVEKAERDLPVLKEKLQDRIKLYREKLCEITTLQEESEVLRMSHEQLMKRLDEKLLSSIQSRVEHEQALKNLEMSIGSSDLSPKEYVSMRSEHRKNLAYEQMVIDFLKRYAEST